MPVISTGPEFEPRSVHVHWPTASAHRVKPPRQHGIVGHIRESSLESLSCDEVGMHTWLVVVVAAASAAPDYSQAASGFPVPGFPTASSHPAPGYPPAAPLPYPLVPSGMYCMYLTTTCPVYIHDGLVLVSTVDKSC